MSKSKTSKWVLGVYDGEQIKPYAPHDDEAFGKLKKGTPIRMQFAHPRSIPLHRLYWVILRIVVNNTEMFSTEDGLHKTFLLASGVVEPVLTFEGEINMIPSSTAFDAMGDDEFKPYFDNCLQLIQTNIMPGVDIGELLAEAKQQARWKEAA